MSGGGADVLRGGAGDDTFVLSGLDFFRVDGGTGNDTVEIAGSGLSFDLTAIPEVALTGIEIIDLTGTGDNTLTLETRDLIHASPTSNLLVVEGDAGDFINASLTGFTSETGPAGTTDYTNGVLTLRVTDAIDQTGVSL